MYRESTKHLAGEVLSSCRIFLKEALMEATERFGTRVLPMVTLTRTVMEPAGAGRHSGKRVEFDEPDLAGILREISAPIESTATWGKARNALQAYIDANGIKPLGPWIHEIDSHYLWPLLVSFLRKYHSVKYSHSRATNITSSLLRHLNKTTIPLYSVIPLEDFSALKPIRLEKGIAIRPVGQTDLRLLGVSHHLNISGKYWSLNPLNEKFPFARTDWWVCEVRLPDTRGSTEAHNEIHRIFEHLQFGLRAFKEGNLSLALALIGPEEEFGRTGFGYNRTMHRFRHAKDNYSLSQKEVREFVRFWKGFRKLMKNDRHYLQIPIRRLVASGLRKDREDSFIDCVIGLEALLSTESERTELSYKFRVRGSVLLSKHRQERKELINKLKRLYDLRSRLVHGGRVSSNDLETYLPFAEYALRKVWRWFFEHWSDEKSNEKGVIRIDEDLCIR